jgi:hypothetical protein
MTPTAIVLCSVAAVFYLFVIMFLISACMLAARYDHQTEVLYRKRLHNIALYKDPVT